jgi:predicted lipase
VGVDKVKNRIVIAFRGSKTLSNWIANLKFARVDSPFQECYNCRVHKGFLDDYNSIADDLFKAVNEIRTKTGINSVLVTGHSLGAALALYAAVDLVIHDGFAQPVLYTFGLPRVGNEGVLGLALLMSGRHVDPFLFLTSCIFFSWSIEFMLHFMLR